MPSQFTPADRETVRERTENMDHIEGTTPLGPGLTCVTKRDKDIISWTGLTEEYGWVPVEMEYDETGTRFVIMPITEVPTDE